MNEAGRTKEMKRPYLCKNCRAKFLWKDRGVRERSMYGIKINDDVCPKCGSTSITSLSFSGTESKYLAYNPLWDKRYYSK